jgi:hypothetical protein
MHIGATLRSPGICSGPRICFGPGICSGPGICYRGRRSTKASARRRLRCSQGATPTCHPGPRCHGLAYRRAALGRAQGYSLGALPAAMSRPLEPGHRSAPYRPRCRGHWSRVTVARRRKVGGRSSIRDECTAADRHGAPLPAPPAGPRPG